MKVGSVRVQLYCFLKFQNFNNNNNKLNLISTLFYNIQNVCVRFHDKSVIKINLDALKHTGKTSKLPLLSKRSESLFKN